MEARIKYWLLAQRTGEETIFFQSRICCYFRDKGRSAFSLFPPVFLSLATIVNTICYHQRLLICLFFFLFYLFAFILCWIYFQAISFCFFSFFWDIFFSCVTSSSALGTTCCVSVRVSSAWQGKLMHVLSVGSVPRLCSPGCAQWSENLLLGPVVQHYSLLF